MNCFFMRYRIGNGYDVHRLQEGLPLWLGCVRIDSPKGFVAHSDGDVAVHALCDAILGALALGDIGLHFPDTAEEWRGASGRLLLGKVMEKARSLGYAVCNADITIALQEPKLRPHIDAMRQALSEVLGCGPDRVSVKATTTERLGFVGRGEGCEVWASVLLENISE